MGGGTEENVGSVISLIEGDLCVFCDCALFDISDEVVERFGWMFEGEDVGNTAAEE